MTTVDNFQRKLIKNLCWVTLILISLHTVNGFLGRPFLQITQLVNLGWEGNLSTWYSSFLFIIAAFFSYQCAEASGRDFNLKHFWKIAAFVFLFMSCDETAQLHEKFGFFINNHLIHSKTFAFSPWPIFLGPFIIIFFIFFIWQIRIHFKSSKKAIFFLIAGIFIFLLSAVIFELTINFLVPGKQSWIWKIENLFEESGEMFAVIIIINGLIEHLKFLQQINRFKTKETFHG